MEINTSGKFRFDKTITLGNVLTVITLVVAGFAAYLSIEIRIGLIDDRTADYIPVRDLVKKNDIRLDLLQSLMDKQAVTNAAVMTQLSAFGAEQAAQSATLKIIVDAVRSNRP